jgi:hypothetical protein
MRKHYKLIVGLILGISLAAGGSAWAASSFDIDNEEHTNTATRVGHKRSQLVNAAGAELGTATNPIRTSPATSPAVQPVSDNSASLTVDSPQLPAALATGGALKATVQNTAGIAGGAPTIAPASTLREIAVDAAGTESMVLTAGTWELCSFTESVYVCNASPCSLATAGGVLHFVPGQCKTRYSAGQTFYLDSTSGAGEFQAELVAY